MASSVTLEDKFDASVKAIQRLPANGSFQPSNITKLIFYGLYKQATLGPCNEPRPSVFNYINRAKWDAWDRCRSMSKEQAMIEYINEIRTTLETMPQTKEVLEFVQFIGPSSKLINDKTQYQTTDTKSVESTGEDDINTKDSIHTLVSTENDLSLSTSSASSSSTSPSDVDEFYDDPSDLLIPSHEEIASNNNIQFQSMNTTRLHHDPHVFSGQNGTNIPLSHLNVSSTPDNERHPNNNSKTETQRIILTALTKLQRDINNISERLNQLETSTHIFQPRELIMSSESNSILRWLPLAGFRRGAIAFILLWPFFVFVLIRLFLHARIIIRIRRRHL